MASSLNLDRNPTRERGLAPGLDRLAFACLCAFAFTVPWGEETVIGGGLAVARLAGLIALGAALLRIAVSWRIRRLHPLHYWMMALVGWNAVSLLWTLSRFNTLDRVDTYVQLFAVSWLIWELARTDRRVVMLLQSYVLGTCVSSAETIRNFALGRTAATIMAQEGKVVTEMERYSAGHLNENQLGLLLALSIPMTFYLLSRRQGRLWPYVYWAQLFAAVLTILLTGSRSATIALAVASLAAPLTFASWPLLQRRLAVVALAGIAVVAALTVPQFIWERLIETGTEVTEGTLTKRTIIWSAGLDVFREHPFVGVGAGAYPVAVVAKLDVPYVAHNTFLSVLVELGVFGELILGLGLAAMFFCAARQRRPQNRFWMVLLAAWTIGVCSGTWEYQKATWLIFAMLIAHAGAAAGAKARLLGWARAEALAEMPGELPPRRARLVGYAG